MPTVIPIFSSLPLIWALVVPELYSLFSCTSLDALASGIWLEHAIPNTPLCMRAAILLDLSLIKLLHQVVLDSLVAFYVSPIRSSIALLLSEQCKKRVLLIIRLRFLNVSLSYEGAFKTDRPVVALSVSLPVDSLLRYVK